MLHVGILLVLHAGVRARRLRLVVRGCGLVPLVLLLLLLIFVLSRTWRLMMRVTARLQTISLILTSFKERIRRGAGVHHAAGERILLRHIYRAAGVYHVAGRSIMLTAISRTTGT